jgi:hypothetical protein
MCRVFKKSLQWYSKRYCAASVTKTFTLEGILIIHRSTPSFLKKEKHLKEMTQYATRYTPQLSNAGKVR